jgi:hypothetical protein
MNMSNKDEKSKREGNTPEKELSTLSLTDLLLIKYD